MMRTWAILAVIGLSGCLGSGPCITAIEFHQPASYHLVRAPVNPPPLGLPAHEFFDEAFNITFAKMTVLVREREPDHWGGYDRAQFEIYLDDGFPTASVRGGKDASFAQLEPMLRLAMDDEGVDEVRAKWEGSGWKRAATWRLESSFFLDRLPEDFEWSTTPAGEWDWRWKTQTNRSYLYATETFFGDPDFILAWAIDDKRIVRDGIHVTITPFQDVLASGRGDPTVGAFIERFNETYPGWRVFVDREHVYAQPHRVGMEPGGNVSFESIITLRRGSSCDPDEPIF